eukprot:CAMPEP_0119198320 /NCGR_PEP_ID=MMETSP1316-20130426/18329_1 /TAXON_ID=41880 /ORGANISM="Pycnococcus provasolii, Strain RCC2336" /LENGTH=50 /DNA_ID=CAMNT_0007194231 /DNA_START=84 /DNA_END=232 /DNA_ORIENTATION=+
MVWVKVRVVLRRALHDVVHIRRRRDAAARRRSVLGCPVNGIGVAVRRTIG